MSNVRIGDIDINGPETEISVIVLYQTEIFTIIL